LNKYYYFHFVAIGVPQRYRLEIIMWV